MTNVFVDFQKDSKELKKLIVSASKKLATASEAIQNVLFNIVASVEQHNNIDQLTNLIVALSSVDASGKVVVGSHAKQIGAYMTDVIPCYWDKEKQTFKLKKKVMKDLDYTKVMAKLHAVRWDQFGKQKADNAFDEAKALRSALGMLSRIVKEGGDERVIKAAQAMLGNSSSANDVLAQIREEKKAS